MADDTETPPPDEIEPDGSPFELQAIEGLPFDAKSDEADAIRNVIEGSEEDATVRAHSAL